MKSKAQKGSNNPSRKPSKNQSRKNFKTKPDKGKPGGSFEDDEDPLLKKKTAKNASRDKKGKKFSGDEYYDDEFDEFMNEEEEVDFDPNEDYDSLDLYDDEDFADDEESDDYF